MLQADSGVGLPSGKFPDSQRRRVSEHHQHATTFTRSIGTSGTKSSVERGRRRFFGGAGLADGQHRRQLLAHLPGARRPARTSARPAQVRFQHLAERDDFPQSGASSPAPDCRPRSIRAVRAGEVHLILCMFNVLRGGRAELERARTTFVPRRAPGQRIGRAMRC